MKFKILFIAIIVWSSSNAQCLRGGCDIGLSTSQSKNGVFIGNYEAGKKSGLGIVYNNTSIDNTASFVNYILGKKSGVQYSQTYHKTNQLVIHTFSYYHNDQLMYPIFRITKQDRKTKMEVAFDNDEGWKKYSGDEVNGELQIKSTIYNDVPTFFAFNGENQIMAITTTISVIEILTSPKTDKYYNGLQLNLNDDRMLISTFPHSGGNITRFRSAPYWDIENPDDGVWLYRKYLDKELVDKYIYDDVLELPSEIEIKNEKFESAFDFIAKQVDEYDFEKGYEGKAKDFIDMLTDIKERGQNKGLTVSSTYDLTMMKLYLQKGDRSQALFYAENAYQKSPSNYEKISEIITAKFSQFEDILITVKK